MEPQLHNFARILQFLYTRHSIHQGKQLHLLFLKKGLINSTLSLANRLLLMYTRCGTMKDAHKLFDEMPIRNCFSWNVMVEAYMKAEERSKSLELFGLMPQKDEYSWNIVVSGFAKAGKVGMARRLFNEMPWRNGVVWNSMIHGYARNGCPRQAIGLFKELVSDPLQRPCGDSFVLATVVGACADMGAIHYGKQIHAQILIGNVEVDPVLVSSLINLYGKCGDLYTADCVLSMMEEPDAFSISALITGYANCGRMIDARRLFGQIENPCVVVWNSLIAGYVSNNEEQEAFLVFNEMHETRIQLCASTIASILSACCGLGYYEHINQIHAYACKVGLISDVVVACAFIDAYSKSRRPNDSCKLFSELEAYDTILLNSMITVYSKCGRIENAKHIFDTMPSRSIISWNSMIVGLSQNGCPFEALELFCQMNRLDLRMDRFSFASVISACASVCSLEPGEQVFARSIIVGLESDQVVSTSLVDFYCKCGFVASGRKLFDAMIKSDEISWNSMLIGYATNGHGLEALELFENMRHTGIKPTDTTFTGVLSACDHCGLVEEGHKWFNVMTCHYHIDPGIEHYSCMIDLFARAGCLEEAMDLIENMPFEADASMWSSVLRGSVAHGEKDLGEKVANRIIKLDPENSGAYVQLSTMFASSGEWESSASTRKLMRQKQAKKYPGYSWGALQTRHSDGGKLMVGLAAY